MKGVFKNKRHIAHLGLPSSITNALMIEGIDTIDKALLIPARSLLYIPRIGKKRASIILEKLNSYQ